MFKTILFDFGGVIAEEGFREGLFETARRKGLEPAAFFAIADDLIYRTGYLTGKAGEGDYWHALRKETGLRASDKELRDAILESFVVRTDMIRCVDLLRGKGFSVVMLSDQTNWLDEIDEREKIFRHFDRVLNSMHIHLSKRDLETFKTVCALLQVKPGETIFVDDNKHHIERAAAVGLQTIHFTGPAFFSDQLRKLTGTACSYA